MTAIVTPAPTPVFTNPDGTNTPTMAGGWTVQSAANGSDQNLVSGV
jgi:hypothetical protein